MKFEARTSCSDEGQEAYAGMSSRVVHGTAWSLAGQVLMLMAAFVSVPVIIRRLGPESYGVFALINILVGYLGFSDMGMGIASTRFAADAYARNDSAAEASVVWTSLLIAAVPAAIGTLVLGLLAVPVAVNVMRVPPYLFDEAVLAVRITAIGFFARSISGVLNTPQVVRLRTRLNTALATGAGICQSLSVVVVVLAGGNLVAAVTAVAVVAMCALIGYALAAFKLLPDLSRIAIRPDLIRPLAKFGGAVVATALLGMLLVNAEKVVLARVSSLTVVAYYAVAFKAALLLTVGPVAMAQWLLPAFVQLQVGSTPALQQQLYERALRVILICLAPLASVLCGWAKPFFALWAGAEFAQESTIPFYVLLFGAAFSAMGYVPQSLLQASGRARLIAVLQAAESLPYLICAILLGYSMGAIGAAISFSLLATTNTIMLFVFARRFTGLSANMGLRTLPWVLAVVLLALPTLTAGIADSLLVRAWATVISLVSYSVLIWARVLTTDERGWMLGTLLRQSRLVTPRLS